LELEKYGYAVKTVTNGEKAIGAIETSPDIDLILMATNRTRKWDKGYIGI